MKIEITEDRKALYAYEQEGIILKTWPVLLIEEQEGFSWVLFADVKQDQMEILAARATFDRLGRLETFDRHIHARDWKHLHRLFNELKDR